MTDIHAEEQRARRAFEAGEYLESARLFEPLATLGSETALLHLGWMYDEGHLGPPDREKAISLWEKAASAGSADGERYLAWTRNQEEHRAWRALEASKYSESARIFEPLAAQGSETALLNLGWMYAHGRLGPPDLEKAIVFYQRAANTGSVDARRYLGGALKKKGDLKRARAVYLEGAKLGSTPCMCRVGKMMVRGDGGEIDRDTGVAWIVRSADTGNVFARRELLRLDVGSSPSLVRRMSFYWKVTLLALRTIPHLLRDPSSSDFQ